MKPTLPPIDLRGAVCLEMLGIDAVVDNLINGWTLPQIARAVGCSPAALLRWIESDPVRADAYRAAKAMRAEALMQRVLELAESDPGIDPRTGGVDKGAVSDKTTRIAALRAVAAKLAPDQYGDQIDVTSGRRPLQSPAEIDARIAALLARLTQ